MRIKPYLQDHGVSKVVICGFDLQCCRCDTRGLVWDGHGRARDDHSFHTNHIPGSPAAPAVPSTPILSVVDDFDPLPGELAEVPPDQTGCWSCWRGATTYLGDTIDALRADGIEISNEIAAHLTPAQHDHINFYGT